MTPLEQKNRAIAFFELAPMRDISSADGTITAIRPIVDGEAPDLWTVLARKADGKGEVIADAPNRAKAMAFARTFRRKLRIAEEDAGFAPTPRAIRTL